MSDVHVPEGLWQTSIMPEGILERWLARDGEIVAAGEAVAAIRVGESLHDVVSPSNGRLRLGMETGGLVEPGTVIAAVV